MKQQIQGCSVDCGDGKKGVTSCYLTPMYFSQVVWNSSTLQSDILKRLGCKIERAQTSLLIRTSCPTPSVLIAIHNNIPAKASEIQQPPWLPWSCSRTKAWTTIATCHTSRTPSVPSTTRKWGRKEDNLFCCASWGRVADMARNKGKTEQRNKKKRPKTGETVFADIVLANNLSGWVRSCVQLWMLVLAGRGPGYSLVPRTPVPRRRIKWRAPAPTRRTINDRHVEVLGSNVAVWHRVTKIKQVKGFL